MPLEAWEERQRELLYKSDLVEMGNTPVFILLLSEKRKEKMNEEASQIQPVANEIGLDSLVGLQGND